MNKFIILFAIILSFFLLFGCTQNTKFSNISAHALSADLNIFCDVNEAVHDINGMIYSCIPVGGASPDLSDYIPYTGATTDVDLGANNLDTNWTYANVIWSDRNRGYGIMYCVDGNIVIGYLIGYSC